MRDQFRKRRGYDLVPWLPVLAGRVIGSSEESERFLGDYRQTLKDMLADNHQGVLGRAAHVRGMTYYTEVQGDSPRTIADGMTLKARSDIPTAEYWYRPFTAGPGQYILKADMDEAASAAHVYGKAIAAAEALTVAALYDPWSFSPRMLKPVADEIFAHGINRILYHESHHQPLTDKMPGLFLGLFGQFFNRNETWAEDAKPWTDYLARTSQMLQEGLPVADVAFFYGEERNLSELYEHRPNTAVPAGYSFDYINPEALLTLLSVKNGRIVTPGGMSYSVLYIPGEVRRFSLPVLRKLDQLVTDGATIVAAKPIGTLGLVSGNGEARRIIRRLWDVRGRWTGRGRAGRVDASGDLAAALVARGAKPDVTFGGTQTDSHLLTVHRRSRDADIYFVSNQRDRAESVEASFRITGKVPELWRAETGSAEPLGYSLAGDRVMTQLELQAHDAVFVVFRHAADQPARSVPKPLRTILATIEGPWDVTFEEGRGAPPAATFDKLLSWPQSTDRGIRYFSGAATYHKALEVDPAWLKRGRRIELDLGDVRELAAVSMNGKLVSTVWHAPYRVDLSDYLQPGSNRLEIRVVNLWPNRLIGDRQPGAVRVAFAPQSSYRADSPLLPSGLLGPVRLVGVEQ